MNSSHSHSNSAHHQAQPQQGINAQFVLAAARRWWKVAIPCGLLLAGVSGAVLYAKFVPEYQAAAMLRISSNTPYIVFNTREDSRQFITNQVELVRSRLVLGPVLSQPEISRLPELREKEDPIAALSQRIKVSSIGGSDLFQISYTGPNPADAAKAANAVTKAYFDLRGQYESERVQRVINLLDEESRGREQEVSTLRDNVRALAKQLKVKDPFATVSSGDLNPQQHPLANLASQMTTSEVELAVLKAQTKAYQEWMDTQSIVAPEGAIEQAVEQHPQAQKLKSQIALNQSTLAEYEAVGAAPSKMPNFQQMQREIERDKKSLEQLREDLKPEVKEQLEADVKTRRLDELQQMRSRSEGLELTINVLKTHYDEQRKNVSESSTDTIELEFKQAELTRAEEVLNLIGSRTLQLRTERRAPERVEMLTEATPPSSPVEDLPYKKLLVVALASLCAPFGLAVAWEFYVLRVSDMAQLERIPNLAVVGEIASLPVRHRSGRRSNDAVSRELSVFEESIDSLRTGLVLSLQWRDMQVLAVVSASSREGKTSVASQLAVSIAQATGEKTLLIDGDMRVPDIHELFEVPLEPGFSKVLDHQCTLDEAIVTTWAEHLHLLPAGKLHVSPHKLLGNGALKSVLDEARQTYRYIIVDTPPVLAAGEALVLAKAADASLLCAMCDVSRINRVRAAFHRLVSAGAKPQGVVLSGVPVQKYAYSYGYYGYSKS